jgi:hypothetical protein
MASYFGITAELNSHGRERSACKIRVNVGVDPIVRPTLRDAEEMLWSLSSDRQAG